MTVAGLEAVGTPTAAASTVRLATLGAGRIGTNHAEIIARRIPGAALAATISELTESYEARLNFLLGDGERIGATTFGNSLFIRGGEGGVVVASEPLDDDPTWQPVPDGSLVEVRSFDAHHGITVVDLKRTEGV